jgi:hypothetical protein
MCEWLSTNCEILFTQDVAARFADARSGVQVKFRNTMVHPVVNGTEVTAPVGQLAIDPVP